MNNAAKVYMGKEGVFATRLRNLMDAKKATQQEVADYIGLTRQSIGQYTDGIALPKIDALYKIAEFFNTSADFLIGRIDTPTKDLDIAQICHKLGLSKNAVNLLVKSNEDKDYKDRGARYDEPSFVEFVNIFADFEDVDMILDNKVTWGRYLFQDIMRFFQYKMLAKEGTHDHNTFLAAFRQEKDNGPYLHYRTIDLITEHDLMDMYLLQIKRGLYNLKNKITKENYLDDGGLAYRVKLSYEKTLDGEEFIRNYLDLGELEDTTVSFD